MAALPIVDLRQPNDSTEKAVALASTLGYFFVPRASPYGQLPHSNTFHSFLSHLFSSSHQQQTELGCHRPPSPTNLDEDTLDVDNADKSPFLRDVLRVYEQVADDLVRRLPSSSVSSLPAAKSRLRFTHHKHTNSEPLPVHDDDESISLQLHVHCAHDVIEYLRSLEHDWKPIEWPTNADDYVLVTLPQFIYRYSPDKLSSETSDFFSITYSYCRPDTRKRTRNCLFSLTENTLLRYFTFFYLYAMQGVPAGFSSTALANYLTAEGKQSSTVGTFVSLSSLPWGLQFVWGPLIDRFQSSAMGRRRPWVVSSQACAFLASLGLLFVGDPPTEHLSALVIAFFVHSVFASIQDASVDAQAITIIKPGERGKINAVMRGGFLIGIAVGAAGLSWILRTEGYFVAALINSVFLGCFTCVTFFIKEKTADQLFPCASRKSKKSSYEPSNDYSIAQLFHELFKGLLSEESLRLYIPILIAYTAKSVFIRAYHIHLIHVLGWSDTSVSILSGAWGTLVVIVVILVGGYLADRIGARPLLLVIMATQGVFTIAANLLEPFWQQRSVASAILILWSTADPMLSAAAMPVLMSLCRPHVEGSQFTTYMSLVNLCDLLGAFVSGHLQRRLSANLIGVGCGVSLVIAFMSVMLALWYEQKRGTLYKPANQNGSEKRRDSLNGVVHPV